uniref:Endonuclease/exonuclease/phosphatase domain-containing protein n=1 Tax=Aureoumbra lagunensis TaxID=44058 RepID=A0A7S3JVU7_9STRA
MDDRKKLRLVHYNVKRLEQLDKVVATLEALKPDAVTLNEVDIGSPENGLSTLAQKLKLESIHFYGHARNGSYGNAILCRQGVTVLEKQLNGGTRVTLPSGIIHHIVRGLLVVQCTESNIFLAVTHLDHISESERLIQIDDLLHTSRNFDRLLISADLNSLTRQDYAQGIHSWTLLEQRNRDKGWTPPIDSTAPGGALHLLHQKGYIDLALLASQSTNTPPTMTASSHCPFSGDLCQRIDYIHASPKLANEILAVSSFVDTQADGSDHAPLVVDLTLLTTQSSSSSSHQSADDNRRQQKRTASSS